ncbi:MAG: hypothetical protein IJ159_00630 [Prevotella sp.]|nr:hypothetical protein [Prevotella sp.]
MKLTKKRLIETLKPYLTNLGYICFKDSITGADGLFAKKLNNGLYLTLGMTIHRFYEDSFTADLYLSKTTCIYCTWGDIPDNSLCRLGFLLNKEEWGPYKYQDIWWSCEDTVEDFIRILKIVEPRLTTNQNLLDQIEKSKDVEDMSAMALEVQKMVNHIPDVVFEHVPQKVIDGIPIEWFKSAELVIKEKHYVLNKHTVKRLGADAYRQYLLNHFSK